MNRWTLIHKYQHLVRLGQARPFLCPECNNTVTFVMDEDAEPVIWCPYDDSAYTPGAMFWGDVNSVVTEFFV